MTMSRDEMLAGLRESIVWLSDLDGRYPLSAPKLRELLHAAITALEAAPAQAEAPPSESARERVWDLCESLGLEGDESALALVQEWIERRQAGVDRLRAELEQARDEVERLYVAASERDTAREQKRAIRERLREVEQERDASKARIEAYECALESTRVAIERMEQERDAATAEVARLRKLFDDAGQGEHNVLALIDFYQELLAAEEQERDAALAKVADLTTLLGRCRDAGLLPVGIHDDVCAALAELDKEQE